MADELDLDMDDDLDFGLDDDDFSFGEEPPKPKNAREAITLNVKQFGTGLKEDLLSTDTDALVNNAGSFVKGALPEKLKEEGGLVGEGVETLREEVDDARHKILRSAAPIVRTLEKVVPKGGMLENLVARAKAATTEDNYGSDTRATLEEDSNNRVKGELGEKFVAENVGNLLQMEIENNRYKSVIELSRQSAGSLTTLVNFNLEVTNSYYRRDLSIKYQLLHIAHDQLKITKSGFDIFKSQLDSVIHNTALPDVVKATSSEKYKEDFRKNLYDRLFSKSRWMTNLTGNIKDKVNDFTTGVTSGLDTVGMATGSAEMMGGMGMSPAAMLGSMASGAVLGTAGKLFGNLGSKLPGSEDRTNKIKALASDPYFALEKKEKNAGNVFSKFLYGTAKDLFKNREEEGKVDLSTRSLEDASHFTNRTATTINKVIPGLLSRILFQVTKYNNKNLNEDKMLRYDYKKEAFTTTKQRTRQLDKEVKEKLVSANTANTADTIIRDISKGFKLNDKEINELRKGLISYVLAGNDISYLRLKDNNFFKYFKGSSRTKLKRMMFNYFNNLDNTLDKDKFENIANLESNLRNLQENLPLPADVISEYQDSGNIDILVKKGFVEWDNSYKEYKFKDKAYSRFITKYITDKKFKQETDNVTNTTNINNIENTTNTTNVTDYLKAKVKGTDKLQTMKYTIPDKTTPILTTKPFQTNVDILNSKVSDKVKDSKAFKAGKTAIDKLSISLNKLTDNELAKEVKDILTEKDKTGFKGLVQAEERVGTNRLTRAIKPITNRIKNITEEDRNLITSSKNAKELNHNLTQLVNKYGSKVINSKLSKEIQTKLKEINKTEIVKNIKDSEIVKTTKTKVNNIKDSKTVNTLKEKATNTVNTIKDTSITKYTTDKLNKLAEATTLDEAMQVVDDIKKDTVNKAADAYSTTKDNITNLKDTAVNKVNKDIDKAKLSKLSNFTVEQPKDYLVRPADDIKLDLSDIKDIGKKNITELKDTIGKEATKQYKDKKKKAKKVYKDITKDTLTTLADKAASAVNNRVAKANLSNMEFTAPDTTQLVSTKNTDITSKLRLFSSIKNSILSSTIELKNYCVNKAKDVDTLTKIEASKKTPNKGILDKLTGIRAIISNLFSKKVEDIKPEEVENINNQIEEASNNIGLPEGIEIKPEGDRARDFSNTDTMLDIMLSPNPAEQLALKLRKFIYGKSKTLLGRLFTLTKDFIKWDLGVGKKLKEKLKVKEIGGMLKDGIGAVVSTFNPITAVKDMIYGEDSDIVKGVKNKVNKDIKRGNKLKDLLLKSSISNNLVRGAYSFLTGNKLGNKGLSSQTPFEETKGDEKDTILQKLKNVFTGTNRRGSWKDIYNKKYNDDDKKKDKPKVKKTNKLLDTLKQFGKNVLLPLLGTVVSGLGSVMGNLFKPLTEGVAVMTGILTKGFGLGSFLKKLIPSSVKTIASKAGSTALKALSKIGLGTAAEFLGKGLLRFIPVVGEAYMGYEIISTAMDLLSGDKEDKDTKTKVDKSLKDKANTKVNNNPNTSSKSWWDRWFGSDDKDAAATTGSNPVDKSKPIRDTKLVNINGGRAVSKLPKFERFKIMYNNAVHIAKQLPINTDFLIGMQIQETAWGSKLVGGQGGKSNNFFNIKCHNYKNCTSSRTHEYVKGKKIYINDGFRVYKSPTESARDFVNFLKRNHRYRHIVHGKVENVYDTGKLFQNAGYATDPNYAANILNITRGDEFKKFKRRLEKTVNKQVGASNVKPATHIPPNAKGSAFTSTTKAEVNKALATPNIIEAKQSTVINKHGHNIQAPKDIEKIKTENARAKAIKHNKAIETSNKATIKHVQEIQHKHNIETRVTIDKQLTTALEKNTSGIDNINSSLVKQLAIQNKMLEALIGIKNNTIKDTTSSKVKINTKHKVLVKH